MASLRGQLHYRAALRRTWGSSLVDAEGARRFWLSLDLETRAGYLHFDDAALVQKMHGHMTSLCKSEIWCRRNVLGGLVAPAGGEAPVERLKGFAFLCPAERDCIGRQGAPTALCALKEVAGSDELFEEMARRLGSGFLQGRPVFNQKDWSVVAEATPNSWEDLQVMAYRLVELAIFQAHKDAKDYAEAQQAAKAAAPVDEALLTELDAGVSGSTPSRRRTRQKRGNASQAAAPASAAADTAAPKASAEAAEADAAEAAEPTEPAEPQQLAAPAAPAAAAPSVAAGAARPPERASSRWAAWLRSLVREDDDALRWRLFDPSGTATTSLRTAVKNTFLELDLEGEARQEDAAWCRRSCYF